MWAFKLTSSADPSMRTCCHRCMEPTVCMQVTQLEKAINRNTIPIFSSLGITTCASVYVGVYAYQLQAISVVYSYFMCIYIFYICRSFCVGER